MPGNTGRQQRDFVGYEYKQVTAESDKVSFLLDGYENFGWEADEKWQGNRMPSYTAGQNKVTLALRRNRKIINKMELTRLQRNFEACVNEIETLERAKTTRALVYALIMGLIGTVFMAGSVFAITAPTPHTVLCILLSVPGFIGWIFPYFIYKKTVCAQTKKLTPLIEGKYDEIYEICEKGNKLLH